MVVERDKSEGWRLLWPKNISRPKLGHQEDFGIAWLKRARKKMENVDENKNKKKG